jgi:hypothetical protein
MEDLQVLEDFVRQLDPGFPFLAVEELGLHLRPERLHHRVIERIADRAQGGHQVGGLDAVGEAPGGELPAVIGVHHRPWCGLTVLDGHLQRVDDQRGVLGVVDRPAHDLAAERVEDRAAVEFPFPGGVFGDVAHPQQIRLAAQESSGSPGPHW